MQPPGPRIGLWGPFLPRTLEASLRLRILAHAFERRIPGACCLAFAPGSWTDPDTGERPIEALGDCSPSRRSAMAERLDAVVVAGAALEPQATPWFVEGPPDQGRCSVHWHRARLPQAIDTGFRPRLLGALGQAASITVDGEDSRGRLAHAGIAAEVAPDELCLLPRRFDPALCGRRLAYLARMGWWPEAGRPVVLEDVAGDDSLAAAAEAAAGRSAVPNVVVVSLARFGDARAAAAPGPQPSRAGILRLPHDAPLEDLVAAVAGASTVFARDRGLRLAAAAYGVPSQAEAEEPVAAGATAEPCAERADLLLDRLALMIAEATEERQADVDGCRPADPWRALAESRQRYEALLRAHDAQGRRLVAERDAVAGLFAAAPELDALWLRARAEQAEGELREARRALAAVLESRTWRWTRWARRLSARLQRSFGGR